MFFFSFKIEIRFFHFFFLNHVFRERGEKPELLLTGIPSRTVEEKERIELEFSEAWRVFEQRDDDTNVYMENNVVRGVTMHKLVERITHPKIPRKDLFEPLLVSLPLYVSFSKFRTKVILI